MRSRRHRRGGDRRRRRRQPGPRRVRSRIAATTCISTRSWTAASPGRASNVIWVATYDLACWRSRCRRSPAACRPATASTAGTSRPDVGEPPGDKMTQPSAPTTLRTRRVKTWSSFGNLGRKPSEYEIVTHDMNHTVGATPLEMGPEVHGNQWLLRAPRRHCAEGRWARIISRSRSDDLPQVHAGDGRAGDLRRRPAAELRRGATQRPQACRPRRSTCWRPH